MAKKAACGPPNIMGTPKRNTEPRAISAPHSPGGVSFVRLNGSVDNKLGLVCFFHIITVVIDCTKRRWVLQQNSAVFLVLQVKVGRDVANYELNAHVPARRWSFC